jgi:hypothetical protein
MAVWGSGLFSTARATPLESLDVTLDDPGADALRARDERLRLALVAPCITWQAGPVL